jgi:hypothetical protein
LDDRVSIERRIGRGNLPFLQILLRNSHAKLKSGCSGQAYECKAETDVVDAAQGLARSARGEARREISRLFD